MTITADFSGGEKTVTTDPLYQWDTGQKLALSGLPATSTDIQVHFANAAMAQAIVKATATENSLPTCDIPNEFLQYGSAAKARAWVFYRASNTEGYTVRTVLIPVTPRKRPNDYVSPTDPDSKGIVEQAIELLENYETDIDGKEDVSNKKTAITGNETSDTYYATIKAIVDYLTANYLGSGNGTVKTANLDGGAVTDAKLAQAVRDAIDAKAPAATAYTFDDTTTTVTFNENNSKIIYLNATVDDEKGIVLTSSDNTVQYFFGVSKSVKVRNKNGASTYTPWELALEKVGNKKNSITNANKTSTDFYPSIKAVADYLTANYLGSGDNTVSWANLAAAVQTLINGKESASNKLTSEDGIDEDSTDAQYPTAKAVYEFGGEIVDIVNEDIAETNDAVADLKAYIGYTSGDILGLQADFENKIFTRLGAAVGKNAGSDFNVFPMYGGRRRVVVDSDGVIDDSIAPASVTETDYDLDVMVYQPKFYYKVVPLKLEKQSSGLGYHIRKANYYITSTPHAGFKVHPLFIDKNGNEVDYVLFSAYEASYLHAESGNYSYFHDGVDTGTNIDWAHDVLKSLPGVKPISGQRKAMTKANMESLAQRKSADWHLDTIQSVSANQLLMAIEYASFNTQSAIGKGVVNNSNSGSNNCASLTGSTSAAAFNSASGMASETVLDVAGTETVNTVNGKLAVSYRGMENPWGNIFKHVNGVNVWGNGHMGGGQPYVCSDFAFNEVTHEGNYKPAGFSIANSSGYISAFGSGSEDFDWLMMPSEALGNSSLPVGDQIRPQINNSFHKIYLLGGTWTGDTACGGFRIGCSDAAESSFQTVGGRLLFVPTVTV